MTNTDRKFHYLDINITDRHFIPEEMMTGGMEADVMYDVSVNADNPHLVKVDAAYSLHSDETQNVMVIAAESFNVSINNADFEIEPHALTRSEKEMLLEPIHERMIQMAHKMITETFGHDAFLPDPWSQVINN
jgi:hypothetical protein